MPDKKRRILILSEIISPYRIPVFNALAVHEAVDLHVIFLAETDPGLRHWPVYKDEISFSYQVLPSHRLRVGDYNLLLNRGLRSCLTKFAPEAVICGGYNYVASWEALWWCRRHQVDFVLWSESNRHDARKGRAWVESMKSYFLARCDRFVVPGKASSEYLQSLGLPEARIAVAPNAVGNGWFAAQADRVRAQAAEFRTRFGLPGQFLLFVGRLVEEKGIFDLLDAYGKLGDDIRSQTGLVITGDGPCRRQLEKIARSIRAGAICFPGFVHRDDLAGLYALAECLILPTHSDPWGLVVNEAMACGLPVVVTNVAGCSPDLVENGWNGYVVSPRDSPALEAAMDSMLRNPELKAKMSLRSCQRIQNYSPEVCAAGLATAAFPAGRQVQRIS